MKKAFSALLAALLLTGMASASFAADWPTKPINVYVTHAPDGNTN